MFVPSNAVILCDDGRVIWLSCVLCFDLTIIIENIGFSLSELFCSCNLWWYMCVIVHSPGWWSIFLRLMNCKRCRICFPTERRKTLFLFAMLLNWNCTNGHEKKRNCINGVSVVSLSLWKQKHNYHNFPFFYVSITVQMKFEVLLLLNLPKKVYARIRTAQIPEEHSFL